MAERVGTRKSYRRRIALAAASNAASQVVEKMKLPDWWVFSAKNA